MDDFHFLRAIAHDPENDTVRLVYADWLEERGDARAAFVRRQTAVRRAAAAGDADRRFAHNQALADLRAPFDPQWVQRMRWLSWLRSSPIRSDLVRVEQGRGLIDVRGGDWDTALLVEGRPIALNWHDCEGSIGQYLVQTGHAAAGAHWVRRLRNLVDGGLLAGESVGGRPLGDELKPLLELFPSGDYQLTCEVRVDGPVFAPFVPPRTRERPELQNYYPDADRNLVCTQTRESLQPLRVAHYRNQIRAGERPIVVTTAALGAMCEFVIDGHHKLAAYDDECVRPAVLSIVRCEAPEISLEEGLSYLPAQIGSGAYRISKGYQANRTPGG